MSWARMKKPMSITLALATLIAAFAIGWALKPGPSSASALKPVAATSSYRLPLTSGAAAHPPAGGQSPQQRYQQWVAAVAAKAGITADTLDSAIRSVAEGRVAAAARAGKIPQARATAIENAIKTGTFGALIEHRIQALRSQGKHPVATWIHHRVARILHNLHGHSVGTSH